MWIFGLDIIVELCLVYLITLFIREIHATSGKLTRSKRTTLYSPYQTGIGVTVAMSIPLDNGRGDTFLAYCFSVGPGQPAYDSIGSPNGLDPPPFTTNAFMERKAKRGINNGLLTRTSVYQILADNLKRNGFNDEYCILKAICQTAQYKLGDSNGVVGDVIHILFTPSTSQDEELPMKYYQAERNGQLHLCDEKYSARCPVSFLDLISVLN